MLNGGRKRDILITYTTIHFEKLSLMLCSFFCACTFSHLFSAVFILPFFYWCVNKCFTIITCWKKFRGWHFLSTFFFPTHSQLDRGHWTTRRMKCLLFINKKSFLSPAFREIEHQMTDFLGGKLGPITQRVCILEQKGQWASISAAGSHPLGKGKNF